MCCLHSKLHLLHQKGNVLLKLLCAAILVFLLYEEVKFYIDKPTETTIIKESLTGKDVPVMALCVEPAFNIHKLKQYGYQEG